jgi:hypothetical protein
MKRGTRWKTHDLSHCDGCDYQVDGMQTSGASTLLQRHADRTGHSISRETGMCIKYEPRITHQRKDI